MPCPFTGPKMFWAGPNFLCQTKNLFTCCGSHKHFVLAQKPILLNANHLFVWHKMFVTATICKYIFGLAQKIWTSTKHFGTCKRTRHKVLVLIYVGAMKSTKTCLKFCQNSYVHRYFSGGIIWIMDPSEIEFCSKKDWEWPGTKIFWGSKTFILMHFTITSKNFWIVSKNDQIRAIGRFSSRKLKPPSG